MIETDGKCKMKFTDDIGFDKFKLLANLDRLILTTVL